MATVAQDSEPAIPHLVAGDRLTREEFMSRWEALPQVKFAELIGGIVYMPSPLSVDHGDRDFDAGTWLGTYAAATPGCRPGANATTYMLEDAPQPDTHTQLRIHFN